MVDAPERIWAAGADHGSGNSAGTWFAKDKVGVEYTRADIAERQIAELRAAVDVQRQSKEYAQRCCEAAEAENAPLRALPLKDEVERVVDDAQTWISENVRPDDAVGNEVLCEIRALLSRLRAGEQEGWLSRAADDVLAERRRQVEAEGWTPEHDNVHSDGQMAVAAACYAKTASMPNIDRATAHFGTPVGWPWGREWWKPKDRRRDLVRAAALLIAEIERLDRLPAAPSEQGGDRG